MKFTRTTNLKTARRAGRRLQDRRGATAVEMAFILPAFLTMIFGCMEFSRISMVRNLTANAAYEAARFSMVQGGTQTDATETVNDVLGRLGLVGGQVVVRFEDEAGAVVTSTAAKKVNVKVDVPYGQNGFFAGFLPASFADITLTSQVTLRTNKHSDEENW